MPKPLPKNVTDEVLYFTAGMCVAFKRNRLTPAEQVALLQRLGVNVQVDLADEALIARFASMCEEWARIMDLPPWDV